MKLRTHSGFCFNSTLLSKKPPPLCRFPVLTLLRTGYRQASQVSFRHSGRVGGQIRGPHVYLHFIIQAAFHFHPEKLQLFVSILEDKKMLHSVYIRAMCPCRGTIYLVLILVQKLAAGRCRCEGHLVAGDPRDTLIRVAEQRHACAVVVGSRGLGPVQRAILGTVCVCVCVFVFVYAMTRPSPRTGSVSSHLVMYCKQPVVVVKPPGTL